MLTKVFFLVSTTDSTIDENTISERNKLYNINRNSITGYVADSMKSVIIYDVEHVNSFYPEILKTDSSFVEFTESGKHNSLIAVPIKVITKTGKTNTFIIRCINKITHLESRTKITDIFSDYDKNLLTNLSEVFQRFYRISEVINERNYILDTLTHEIRNPITSIFKKLNEISSLDREKLKIQDEHTLLLKIKDIDLMLNIINNWVSNTDLMNTLLQEKSVRVVKIWINLKKTIENVIYWIKPQLINNNLTPNSIKLIGFDDCYQVYLDESHFIQILYNILTNSLKYSQKDRIQEIEIECVINHHFIFLNFKDKGIGIEEKDKNDIFKVGFRSTYAKFNKIEGKGFGLWVSLFLAESNDLKLIASRLKNPTIFTLIVPVASFKLKSKYL